MSLEAVKARMRDFLRSHKPEIVVIRGNWDISKSYFWQQILQEERLHIATPKYAHVSLFGINNLQALKWQIFKRTVPTHNLHVPTLHSALDQLSQTIQHYQAQYTQDPLLTQDTLPQFLPNMIALYLQNMIICLDDLEGKGHPLTFMEIFGLAAFLKHQQKCKIIFLLNDHIYDQADAQFIQFKNKVVDHEITLKLTALECVDTLLPNQEGIYAIIRQHCLLLDLKNLRVIQKSILFIELLHPYLAICKREVMVQIVRSVILFHWSLYCEQENALPLNYILQHKNSQHDLPKTSQETVFLQQWTHIVSHYLHFHVLDDLDDLLATAIQTGIVPDAALREAIQHKNQFIMKNTATQQIFAELDALLLQNFDHNAAQVIAHIEMIVREYMEVLDQTHFDRAIQILLRLGATQHAKSLQATYQTQHFSTVTPDITPADPLISPYHTLSERLLRIATNNAWDIEDEHMLAEQSVENYIKLIRYHEGKLLHTIMRACRLLTQFTPTNPCQKQLAHNITAAIQQLSQESVMNALRMERFGFGNDLSQ